MPQSQQVAIVTGGGRGIGRAIALRLAGTGAAVCVNYAAQAGAASQVASEITKSGGRASLAQADVADADAVIPLVDRDDSERERDQSHRACSFPASSAALPRSLLVHSLAPSTVAQRAMKPRRASCENCPGDGRSTFDARSRQITFLGPGPRATRRWGAAGTGWRRSSRARGRHWPPSTVRPRRRGPPARRALPGARARGRIPLPGSARPHQGRDAPASGGPWAARGSARHDGGRAG